MKEHLDGEVRRVRTFNLPADLPEAKLEAILADREATLAFVVDAAALRLLDKRRESEVVKAVYAYINAATRENPLPEWRQYPYSTEPRKVGLPMLRGIWMLVAERVGSPEAPIQSVLHADTAVSIPEAVNAREYDEQALGRLIAQGTLADTTDGDVQPCSAGVSYLPDVEPRAELGSVSTTEMDPVVPPIASTHPEEDEADRPTTGGGPSTPRIGPPLVPVRGTYSLPSHDELMSKLKELARQLGPRNTRLWDAYLDPDIRRTYLGINAELNVRGRVGPYWRPHPKLPPSHHTEGQKILNNDKRVLDLHWLSIHARPAALRDPRFLDLFETDEFDFKAAWELVSIIGETANILEHLDLSLGTQMSLTALQSQEARGLLDTIEEDADRLATRLRHSGRSLYVRRADDWRQVRLAYLVAQVSISRAATKVAEPTDRHVTSLYRLISGRVECAGSDPTAKPITAKAIAKKLESMEPWIGGGTP